MCKTTPASCRVLSIAILALLVGSAGLLAQRPLEFVPNRGQWDASCLFRMQSDCLTAWLGETSWTLGILDDAGFVPSPGKSLLGDPRPLMPGQAAVVRMTFVNATGARNPRGEGHLPHRLSYFIGDDPAHWATNIRPYARVTYKELQPGIDVILRDAGGVLEYDVIVAPGVEIDDFVVSCEGLEHLSVDADGALLMHTALGVLKQTPPVAWQVDHRGWPEAVACSFRLLGDTSYGFSTPDRDASLRLVIDPGIVWSRLLAGSLGEDVFELATGPGGSIYGCGTTTSLDFPWTPGAYQASLIGTSSMHVSRFGSSGTTGWTTYLGGPGIDSAYALDVDSTGCAIVGGCAGASGFPLVNAFDATWNGIGSLGYGDGALAVLSPDGASLLYGTYLGGSDDDGITGVSVDGQGLVTITGFSFSPNMPGGPSPVGSTVPAYQPTLLGSEDGIVAVLDRTQPSTNQLFYFSYLGGNGRDSLNDGRFLANGQVVVAGASQGQGYPILNAYQASYGGGTWDAVVTVLDLTQATPSGQLAWSSFLGGAQRDTGHAMCVDDAGVITLAGSTQSANFPKTASAYQPALGGGRDVFCCRLDPSQPTPLLFSTYLGGLEDDYGNDMDVDASGTVLITGTTGSMTTPLASSSFPITQGCSDPTFNGGVAGYWFDAFLSKLSPDGSQLHYSTFIGGSSYDFGYAVVNTDLSAAAASGLTNSTNFPFTLGSFLGNGDGYVLTHDMLPTGASRFGTSTPGCQGPVHIGVTAMPTTAPWLSTPPFALTCSGAPPAASGILGLSSGALATPLILGNLAVWVDISPPAIFNPIFVGPTDAKGTFEFPLPLPPNPALVGATGHFQFVWPDPCTALSASSGITITVQP